MVHDVHVVLVLVDVVLELVHVVLVHGAWCSTWCTWKPCRPSARPLKSPVSFTGPLGTNIVSKKYLRKNLNTRK